MATIGQLVINVGMEVADMIGASEKAEKSFSYMVKRMEKDAKIMRKELNNLGADFFTMGEYAVGAAAVGLAAIVKHSFDTADALGKTSDALGISTEKLSQLQFAASLAGVNTEAFNGSMFTMVKNVADASMGLGKAQKAFVAMGIDAQALVTMAPDKQFALIADKIGSIENPAIKAQLAMKIFGDSGAAMLTVMKDGAVGLEDAAAQADALGLSISRVDAAKIEQANDAMQAAGGVFAGVGNTIAIMLAPAIEGLSKDFIKMATDAGGWKDDIKNAFDIIVKVAGYVADAFDGISIVILGMKLGFQGAAFLIIQDAAAIAKSLNVLGLVSDSNATALQLMADDMQKAMDGTKKSIIDLAVKMEKPHDYKKVNAAYKKSSETMAKQSEKFFDKDQALIDSNKALWFKAMDEKAKKNQAMLEKIDQEAQKYINKSVIDTTSGQEKLRAEYDATVEHFSGGTAIQLKAQETAWTIYNNKLKDMNGKVSAEMHDKNYEALKAMVKNTEDMSGEAVDKRKAAMKEMEKRDNEWGKNFKDKFIDATGAAKSMYDKMGELGTAWGKATESTLANAINDGIMGTPKTPEEYGQALGGAMSAAFATLAAETIMTGMADMYVELEAASSVAGSAGGGAYSAAWMAAVVLIFAWLADHYGARIKEINNDTANIITLKVQPNFSTADWDAAFDPIRATVVTWATGHGILYSQSFRDSLKKNLDDSLGSGNAFAWWLKSSMDVFGTFGSYQTSFWEGAKKAIDNVRKSIEDLIETMKKIPGGGGGGGISVPGTNISIPSPFATGGIMTAKGALPLNAYAGGGIADRPQVALFGEGRMNEAYVPLPDGKSIPVTMKGNQQQGGDVILMIDGQVLGKILNAMSQQGRLSLDPIAIRSGYAT